MEIKIVIFIKIKIVLNDTEYEKACSTVPGTQKALNK